MFEFISLFLNNVLDSIFTKKWKWKNEIEIHFYFTFYSLHSLHSSMLLMHSHSCINIISRQRMSNKKDFRKKISKKMLSNLCTLKGHQDRVWQINWSNTELKLASCSGDKSIRLWKLNSDPKSLNKMEWKCCLNIDDAHKRTVRSVSFSPQSKQLASASFDGNTAIWNLTQDCEEYECAATLEGHENEVKSVAWNTPGTLLATCGRDKSVWIWEVLDGIDFECISVLQEHSQDVKMVTWHPNLDILASASYDDTIKIWKEDDDDWYCAQTLQGHTSTVWCLDFNQNGDKLGILLSCSIN